MSTRDLALDHLRRYLEWADGSATPDHVDAPPVDILSALEGDGLVNVAGVRAGGTSDGRLLVHLTASGRYELDRLHAVAARNAPPAPPAPPAPCGVCAPNPCDCIPF